MGYYEQSFKDVIEVEGGYSNHADDFGGATNWGITEENARRRGWSGDMRKIPKSFAMEYYKVEHWEKLFLPDIAQINHPIAHELFDTGVNMGNGIASRFLQRALNALNAKASLYPDIAVDDAIGPKTVDALRRFMAVRGSDGMKVMLRALNALQGARYIELAEARERNESFVFGWFLHRVVIA